MKKVFVFGNEDLPEDSLPLRILPDLQKQSPDIEFCTLDPNEDWDIPDNLVVIDTAVGIEEVTIFDSLEKFTPAPRVSMHDFDALANLRLLKKLGKIRNITIIAIPSGIKNGDAVKRRLQDLLPELVR